jgi:hypothetical protein
VCNALRQLVLTLHPSATEVVWPRLKIASYGFGLRKNSRHYAYIAVHPKHINMGLYHGARLSNPQGILEGSGKNLRHTKIRDTAIVREPSVESLLREAIVERENSARDAGPFNREDVTRQPGCHLSRQTPGVTAHAHRPAHRSTNVPE